MCVHGWYADSVPPQSKSPTPLIPDQRQHEIIELLRTSMVLSVRELTETMNVSHMTVRRDISALEEAGLVESVHGGVRLLGAHSQETPVERAPRTQLETDAKQAIAQAATAHVQPESTVFLDAGTTCEAMVSELSGITDLTVVTNDFLSAMRLMEENITAIHTGGLVDINSGSSSGPLAAATLATLSIDYAFLSAGAWDLDHGLTTSETDKLTLKRAAHEVAERTILVVDSTKFGTHARFKALQLAELDLIITDDRLPEHEREHLTEVGITVEVAPL